MSLRDIICERFPPSFNKYIEVFGGAGWVLFHKQKDSFEIYNDYDSRLTNLFQVIRENPEALIKCLNNFPINGREEFHSLRKRMKEENGSDIEKAADFFRIIRYSYGSKLRTYSAQPCDISTFYPIIRKVHNRLKSVIIENRDFESCIKQYDSPETFFYLDPPYYGTENFYDAGFAVQDHKRLFDTLCGISGYFLLSYNACDPIRKMYANFHQEELNRLNNLGLVYGGGNDYSEILISNYDTSARRNQQLQLELF